MEPETQIPITHQLFHFSSAKIFLTHVSCSQIKLQMITDRGFYQPLYKVKELHTLDQNGAPLYIYDFDYRGSISYSLLYAGNTNNYGVVHCDDLIYLFNSPTLFPNNFPENTPDKLVSQEFVDYFVHFAVHG